MGIVVAEIANVDVGMVVHVVKGIIVEVFYTGT